MIKTFKCKETEGVYHGRFSRRLPRDSQRAAARKLEMLSAATRLESLKVPPANMLEKLGGDRVGQHSIRINDNGEYVSSGETAMLTTWRLLINYN